MNITADDIQYAIQCASKKRTRRPDVKYVLRNLNMCVRVIYEALEDGSWCECLHYRPLIKMNNNGKLRHILSPDLFTLILQHLAVNLLTPAYQLYDNGVGLNCKKKHGITANDKKCSVVKRLKHIYYDRRDLNYAVIIDQRECYAHIQKKQLRKALKTLTQDKFLIDFCVEVSFCGKQFPIGTPSSPPMHHIIMLAFDRWAAQSSPAALRYADDVFLPFPTKEEAQQMKWRVKMYWWYMYGLRAKSFTQRVISLDDATDFCGFIFHRNKNRTVTSHDKGYVSMREDTYLRALQCNTNESYASYFGLMKHADMYAVMRKIETTMNLRELTAKIKIDRKLDAANIELKELATSGVEFTIYDYDLRKDAKGVPNWIKCLIGIPEKNSETGEPTGKILAREFHGGAESIVKFHVECEKLYGKAALLPMTGMVIEQRCGYIYQGSTNMMEYIES